MTDFARLVLDVDTQGLRNAERDLNNFSDTANRSVDRVGKSMQNFGLAMTGAVTAPLALFGATSIRAASDAAELQSAFNQTFGEMAASMNEWAETTGDAMGRSTQAMQRLANSYGLFFNNLPVAREEAARMSRTFAELTQDFASFHNLREEDAMGAFRSGLAGETEGLRRFGIDISAAAVETKALAMGLAETSKELTEQDKILARYNLILDGTKNAQGDVARTSGGTANQLRSVNEAFDELQVKIGTKLLPAITPILTAMSNLLNNFATLPSSVQTGIVAIAGFTALLGPLALGLGFAATAFSGLTAAALPWIALGAGIAAAAYAIGQNWDRIGPALSETATMLQTELGPVFVSTLNEIKETAIELWEGPFGEALRTAGSNLKDLGATIGSVLGPVALATLRGFASLIGTTFELVGNVLNTVISLLSGDFAGAWEGVKNTVSGVLMGLLRLVEAVFPGISQNVRALYEGVKTYLGTALTAVFDSLIARIRLVEQSFAWLYDRVVGNSHIPDMVDEIGENMRRLDQEMVAPARSSASATEMAFRSLQQSVSGLFDRLFPERAELNRYISDLETLREAEGKSIISARAHAEARARLAAERMGYRIGELPTAELPEVEVGDTTSAIKELTESISGLAGQARSQTVQVAESFKQMADNVLQSLQRMVGAIKGGNFLDIFSSVLSFGLQLGGMGAFGSGVQSALNGARIPSFAGGGFTGMGPRTGGLDGRGGFLAMMHPRESVIDHNRRGANDNIGGGMVFNIDARGSSDPEAVRQQVQRGILEAAPSIVAAAEQRTISTLRRPRLAGVL